MYSFWIFICYVQQQQLQQQQQQHQHQQKEGKMKTKLIHTGMHSNVRCLYAEYVIVYKCICMWCVSALLDRKGIHHNSSAVCCDYRISWNSAARTRSYMHFIVTYNEINKDYAATAQLDSGSFFSPYKLSQLTLYEYETFNY